MRSRRAGRNRRTPSSIGGPGERPVAQGSVFGSIDPGTILCGPAAAPSRVTICTPLMSSTIRRQRTGLARGAKRVRVVRAARLRKRVAIHPPQQPRRHSSPLSAPSHLRIPPGRRREDRPSEASWYESSSMPHTVHLYDNSFFRRSAFSASTVCANVTR